MHFTRRDFLKASTVPIAMSTLPVSFGSTQSLRGRKNVLLIIADDLGRDAGIYGNPVLQTPHIDRLAQDGTRFSHAFVTTSSCSPSRSVIYSGLYPHTTGQWGLAGVSNIHSYSTLKSVPALLQAKGYRTALIGKYHVLPEEVYPFAEHFTGYQSNRNTADMAQTVEEFLRADDGRPFFLVICPADPHRDADGDFANDHVYHGLKPVRYDPAAIPLPYFMADLPAVRQDVAEYYQAISRLDAGIGMFLNKLAQSGFAHKTLVIFTSDNGAPFPGAKVNLYEPGVRVPLIVRSPLQTKRGVVHHSLVSLLDLAPTILEWASAQSPHILPGKSLLAALEEKHQRGWDEVYFSHTLHSIIHPYFMRGRRTYRYKLIWNIMHQTPFIEAGDVQKSAMWNAIFTKEIDNIGGRTIRDYIHRKNIELYDMKNDPHELNNLAENPRFFSVVQGYMNKIVRMMQSTNDEPMLEIVNDYKNLDILLETVIGAHGH